jgi:hypothetical protein
MAELSDYSKFAEGPLEFPINGKRYVLPEQGIEAGITLAGIVSGKNKAAARMEGVELWKLLLGPLWDEMIADGVPLAAATRAGLTALADHQYGRDVAEITWETGADPKVLEPYLEARAAKTANRVTRRSNSTGGAKKTPSRASTRATSSRPK